jgi:hypothetical protein
MAVSGMMIFVECPSCENRFDILPDSADHRTQCPKCHYAFDADEHVLHQQLDQPKPDASLPAVPKPRCLVEAEQRRAVPVLKPPRSKPPQLPAEAPSRQLPPANSGIALDEQPLDQDDTNEDFEFPDEVPQYDGEFSSPYRVALAIVLGLVSLLAICGIIYFLVSDSGDPIAEVSANADATALRDATATETANSPDAGTAQPFHDATRENGERNERIKTGNKLYDALWERNGAHVLEVGLADSKLRQSIPGIVIDRRGWVLTRLHEVERLPAVQFAQPQAAAWNQPFLLRDLGKPRSVVSAIPSLNLCVFEVAGESLPADEMTVNEDFRFESDAMLYAMSPVCDSFTKPFVKCRILDLVAHRDLPESVQGGLSALQISVSSEFQWIVHDGLLNAASAPAPLFDENGALVGIHLYYDEVKKSGYAIPAMIVPGLRSGALGSLTVVDDIALKSLISRFGERDHMRVDVAAKPLADAEAGGVKRGDYKMLDIARQRFQVCDEKIDWLPKTMDEYRQLQQFVDMLVAMDEVATDETIDVDRRTIFELEADDYYDLIGTIEWPLDKQMEEQNAFALESLRIPGQPFFAYARVDVPSAVSREYNDGATVLLTVIGSNHQIMIPIARRHGDLDIGTLWLVVGRNDADWRIKEEGDTVGNISLIHARRLIGRPK